MQVVYLDTSALLKCYVQEPGSAWMVAQCSSAQTVAATALITKTEAVAALAAKFRRGGLMLQAYQQAEQSLFGDFVTRYRLLTITPSLIDLASALAQRQTLRGYDAVQLAAGLTLNNLLTQAQLPSPTFLSADDDLLQAAQNEGLNTDNPNRYP